MTETQARILVVEDEPLVAADICARLKALGYEPLGPVGTADEALRQAASESPDLVLMDVVLPGGMDGVEAAAELQRQAVPVVYLTAHSDDTLLERAKITEPFGYLVKPHTERELHATVVLALHRQRMRRQLAQASAQLEQAQVELERKVAERTAHLVELNQRLVDEAAERMQIEQALRESERYLRQIIDLVPHRICVKDAEGRFLLANRAAAAAYGLTADTMIGRSHRELHTDTQQLERMLAADRAVIDRGESLLNLQEAFTGADGCLRAMRTTKIPYRLPGQERSAVLCLAVDITEERLNEQRLIASEEKYRAILENAVDAIFLCAGDGRILDANRRAGELLGYTKDELLAMTADKLHPVEEHERLHEVFAELEAGHTTLVVHPVLRKDGTMLYCEVAATPLRIGDQLLMQGIFRDVTERRQQEDDRLQRERAHRDTLIREVHHRIKNNLQGVIGLLYRHVGAHPELEQSMASVVTQVQSIAVVHGLQGQGGDGLVRLCDMAREITRNASMLAYGNASPVLQLTGERAVVIDKDEAVAVALIINELLLNALKHGAHAAEALPVRVCVMRADIHAEVQVTNAGRLPSGFDFAAGRGIGTGLGLVRSLLPATGARLDIAQDGAEVRVSLRLTEPVVRP